MDKSRRRFSDQLKRQIIGEVVSGKITKEQARRSYKLKGKSAILNWMRSFEKSNHTLIAESNYTMAAPEEHSKELLLKIKRLERTLEESELKAESYSKMIDIAERELKISIRKKYNTKQSKR